MIKLLFLIIIFIGFATIKMVSAVIGAASLAVDKRGTYINYARQYVSKIASYATQSTLRPYINIIVDKSLEIYDKYKQQGIKYNSADIIDLIECTLELCLKEFSKDEYYRLIESGRARILNLFSLSTKQNAEQIIYEIKMRKDYNCYI